MIHLEPEPGRENHPVGLTPLCLHGKFPTLAYCINKLRALVNVITLCCSKQVYCTVKNRGGKSTYLKNQNHTLMLKLDPLLESIYFLARHKYRLHLIYIEKRSLSKLR